MSVNVDLQVDESVSGFVPAIERFVFWVEQAVSCLDYDVEVCVRVVNLEESCALNHSYRQKNQPTNVLSFPVEFPDGVNVALIGDIVICAPIVAQEAQEFNVTEDARWAHMVVHGVLHLLGYDHMNDKDASVMESLEAQCLNQLGFEDPYA